MPRRPYAPRLLAVLLCCAGCAEARQDAWPDAAARLYYPAALAASATRDVAYIVSTNADQRFAGGWVTALPLAPLARGAGLGAALATAAPLHVPSLGGTLALTRDGAHAALPHRGSGLLTLIDLDAAGEPGGHAADRLGMRCGTAPPDALPAAQQAIGCGREYLVDLARVSCAPAVGAGAAGEYRDAYAAATVRTAAGDELVAIGYLGAARLTLLAVDFAAQPPVTRHAGAVEGTGLTLTGLAAGARGDGWLLGSARKGGAGPSDSSVYELDVGSVLDPVGTAPALLPASLAADLGTRDVAAVVAAPGGARLFAATHGPDALAVLRRRAGGVDVTWETVGVAAADGADLAALAYLARPDGDLVVAAARDQDALLVFAVADDVPQLVARLPLSGHGPTGLLAVTVAGTPTLLVTTFEDHGLLQVDVSAAVPSQFHEVDAYHETAL